jgi:predicted RNA binding protein YcfA (HicA-like mRNA interferase family)
VGATERQKESVIVPRKVRELIQDLTGAGFYEIQGGGKGSHRKFAHAKYAGAMTLSGKDGEDSKPYQAKQVKLAIEEVKK